MEEEKKANKYNLKSWIKDNFNILAIFGTFGTISAVFTNLYFQMKLEVLSYISFLTFIMFVLVGTELIVSFPRKEDVDSWRLTIFEYLTMIFMFLVSLYLFETYKELILNFIFFIFLFIYTPLFIFLGDKLGIFLWLRKVRKERTENLLSFIFLILFLMLMIILSYFSQKVVLNIIAS